MQKAFTVNEITHRTCAYRWQLFEHIGPLGISMALHPFLVKSNAHGPPQFYRPKLVSALACFIELTFAFS